MKCEKQSAKEQIRFLDIAKGSAAEFATQTYIGIDIGYIEKTEGKQWIEESGQILSMLSNLEIVTRES
jgi:four helix bundle protein